MKEFEKQFERVAYTVGILACLYFFAHVIWYFI